VARVQTSRDRISMEGLSKWCTEEDEKNESRVRA
jgi:hypothetical protein